MPPLRSEYFVTSQHQYCNENIPQMHSALKKYEKQLKAAKAKATKALIRAQKGGDKAKKIDENNLSPNVKFILLKF